VGALLLLIGIVLLGDHGGGHIDTPVAHAPEVLSGLAEGAFADIEHVGLFAVVVGRGRHVLVLGRGLFLGLLVGVVAHVLLQQGVLGRLHLFGCEVVPEFILLETAFLFVSDVDAEGLHGAVGDVG